MLLPRPYISFLFLLSLLSASFSPLAADLTDYWEVDAYVREHPNQRLLMSMLAARVSAPAEPVSDKQRQLAPVRIAKIYPGDQGSDYWRRNLQAFTYRMQELGLPYELSTYFSGPTEQDISQQMAQLEQALNGDPDYLVYTLSGPEHVPVIERIIARGRPKVILQNITTPLHRWDGMQPLLYAGFDHVTGSRMLADYMSRQSEGDYVVLMPARGYLSEVRGDSFVRAMGRSGSHRLVETYYTDLSEERAYRATLDALQRHPQLHTIYACATDIALGAARALRQQGREDVLLNGWGGGANELNALRDGTLDVTVMRMNDDSGVAIAEAITQDALGLGKYLPLIFSGELVLVDRHMSDETLQSYRQRAFRYSDSSARSELGE